VKQIDKDALLRAASAKLGISDDQLRAMLESGDSEALMRTMKPKDKAQLGVILRSKSLMEKLAQDPRTAKMVQNLQRTQNNK
jgi:hypothetical protein